MTHIGEFLTVLLVNLSNVRIIPREVILSVISNQMDYLFWIVIVLLVGLLVVAIKIYRRLMWIRDDILMINTQIGKWRQGMGSMGGEE